MVAELSVSAYDLLVLPAERVEDLREAVACFERSAESGRATPGEPVAGFVADLEDAFPPRDGVPTVRVLGTDDGALVSTDEDPMGRLARVAGLARGHDLAVLDVQTGSLYDPRHSVAVDLATEAGPQLPYLTAPVLDEVLAAIVAGDYRWLSLTRDGSFVQTFRDEDGSWLVEHRDALRSRLYAARTRDEQVVSDLLWSWVLGDRRWAGLLSFSPLRLEEGGP